MEMSKKQVEFWVALLVLCIIFATAIMLVDFGIKASILEQSNRIRLQMEEWEVRQSGRNTETANAGRATNDAPDNPAISPDVLVEHSPGMETGNARNGATQKGANTRQRQPKPSRPASPRTIPNGD